MPASHAAVKAFCVRQVKWHEGGSPASGPLWQERWGSQGWTRWPTEVPSNPYHSVILW